MNLLKKFFSIFNKTETMYELELDTVVTTYIREDKGVKIVTEYDFITR